MNVSSPRFATHESGSQVLIYYQQAQPEKASFLSLPIELRIAIHQHLVPNAFVAGYWFENPPQHLPFRDDEQPCCPAILRTNRQIYNESIGIWYGSARFRIYITERHLYFLGSKIHNRDAKLPSCFRLIRSLIVDMKLQCPREQTSDLVLRCRLGQT